MGIPMLILDTDHLSDLERQGRTSPLFRRLDESLEPLAVTIVTIEEQLRGWLAEIHRRSHCHSNTSRHVGRSTGQRTAQ